VTAGLQVVDVEARTPVGLTAATAAAAVRASIGRVSDHPFMVDPAGEPVRGALDPRLDPEIFGPQRLATLAAEPLERLCDRLPPEIGRGLLLVLALPEHRPGWDRKDEARLLEIVGEIVARRFKGARVVPAATGHAGGLQGVQLAPGLLRGRGAEICVVGGVDSYYHPDTLDWLYEQRRAATEEVRSGFFPGEGAGFVVLAGHEGRRQWGLDARASVLGAEAVTEKIIWSSDTECLGLGLAQALSGAAAALGSVPPIDRIVCDINGERYRSQEWGLAILRTAQLFKDATTYEAPASAWGDMGAASGPLFAVLAVQGWARGYAPGRHAMLFAGSDGGTRAAVLLERVEGGRR
jgi:3-oxoacyl-[acyl-carrier-protein] synthase-1